MEAFAALRSTTVLVSTTEYNARGQVSVTSGPCPRNREVHYVYDDGGGLKQVIQNYVDGDPSTGNPDEDIVTDYAYNSGRLLSTLTTTTKKAGQAGTDVQTTDYVYGTMVGDGSPAVYRNDLVRAVIYADSDDTFDTGSGTLSNGNDSTYDRVEYRYNRQGEVIEVKDQAGTTHQYDFDKMRRVVSDRATALGSGIDGSVRRVDTAYTIRGQVESITSYDDPDPGEGTAVNQVYYTYNDWNLVAREYQEHEGAKDANTLYVQYNYADADQGLRLETVRYPNGRLVHYTYGSSGSANDNLNRLAAICDDDSGTPGQALAAYEYLGLGTIVIEDYAEPEVKLDLFGGTSGTYAGLDAFNRVVDLVWKDYGADPDTVIEEYRYGYDVVGQPRWKENVVAEANGADLDELYAYDEIFRLIGIERGDLYATHDALENGTKNFEQDWSLDGLGNWSGFDVDSDGNGTADLEQDRAINAANEITDVTEGQGQEAWVTPVYDRAGNMTTLPKPSNPDVALTAVYDAWNRLVEVKEGEATIAHYEYDGLGRLVVQANDTSSPAIYTHQFYTGVQQIETRDAGTANAQPETLQPHLQYVWSARYIDAAVLRDENTDQDGQCDDGRLYYLTDANHNVTALSSASGDVLERYVYDPYGKTTIYDDDWSDTRTTSSENNTHLYTGRQLDPATGLYYYRARWYDTGTGGFLQPDPLGLTAGPNLRQYCHSRPLGETDPTGLFGEGGTGGRQWDPREIRNKWDESNYVFEGTKGSIISARAGLQEWGQGGQCEGDLFHAPGDRFFSRVRVYGGNACNTVANPCEKSDKNPEGRTAEHAGGVMLYLRDLHPGEYEVTIDWLATVDRWYTGAGGGAHINFSAPDAFGPTGRDLRKDAFPSTAPSIEIGATTGTPYMQVGATSKIVVSVTKREGKYLVCTYDPFVAHSSGTGKVAFAGGSQASMRIKILDIRPLPPR